ncbi:WD40 repeat domain-containing protein [Tychonema sp. BBK16]|uniref:WD40 repeat domain-containing protein n=1 Tax=Tychonema sp. BBK16 TaxID=2699888 RepID=UPI001F2A43C2|nr:WD40 repeat domain-containing protein [Tychonema sp. BBK16]MCF6373229.1 WD40 repeat domain-containing protein [Tychonema sp. BBK16]
MVLPRPVSDALIELLKPIASELGERLGASAVNERFAEIEPSGSSTLNQQIKKDPRWIKAQVKYLQRQQAREQELIAIASIEEEWVQEERANRIKAEELRDKRAISRLCRELMREFQAEAIRLKLSEIQSLWDRDNWFSNLSRQETEQILQQQQHRLLLLVAPAKISEDCPDSFRNNLNIELPAKLRAFLSQHYPQHGDLCPVQFYGDYFKKPISDIDVERLQTVLSPVPTAILYSDISDYEVNFHIGFWGVINQSVSLVTMQPWNWEEVYHQLKVEGKDEKLSLRIVRQIIVTIHKLLAAFLADLYYLNIDFTHEPQLFNLNAEFAQEWFSQDWALPYIETLKEIQQQQRITYQGEMRRLVFREAKAKAERKRAEEAELKRSEEASAASRRAKELAYKLKNHQWRCVHTLPGHSSFVNSLAISPDGKTLASGSWDKTIKIWNLETGEFIGTLTGHSDRVNSVAISCDGQMLVSGSSDETIKFWNLQTGELLCTFPGHSMEVNSVAISPHGQVIASCGGADNTIKLWNLRTGELLRTLRSHSDNVNAVVFSPDGKILASGSSDATSKVWNAESGKLLRTLSGLNVGVNSVAIGPDGQILASVSNDYTIKLRNLQTGSLLRILNSNSDRGKGVPSLEMNEGLHILQNYVSRGDSVAISGDGLTLASGCDDNTIKIWNLLTGELLSSLSGHLGTVYSVAIAPSGNILVSGSADETIKIWRCD